ncbi:MAG: hypothetical protein ACFFA4_07310 [Promethearchaeota archaeon]
MIRSAIVSLILMSIFIVIGILFYYIGVAVIATNMSIMYFVYVSIMFWVLAILMFATFIHNLVHKEFKVKKANDLDRILDDTFRKFADKD